MSRVIDGKLLAAQILADLQPIVANLRFRPIFCDVLVGDDPVSLSYVNTKARRAQEIGLEFMPLQLPITVTTAQVVTQMKNIQSNPRVAGLIVQLPLPTHLDTKEILNSINPVVDVDCLSEINSQLFYAGQTTLIPPTAGAVMAVLDSLNLDLSHLKILVIGQGDLVGRPVTHLLRERGLTVEVADKTTADLMSLSQDADVIISGTGQPKLINTDMIKLGSVVIDCGSAESAGSIVGDVDTESVSSKAGYLSPVPGGVGPVTVARLLYNVVVAAKELHV